MPDTGVPVFLIAGFLDSGKTTFLRFTLDQDYFRIDGKTLLILCEQGEEEFDPFALARNNTVIELIESEEELTTKKLNTLQMLHNPERVIIEYNGMWLVSRFEQMKLPRGWEIEQRIVCVDASTFQLYLQNMKSIFIDMVKKAELVMFNRSNDSLPLANFRRSVKAANQACDVVFENENGEINDIFQDELPYDIHADLIEIAPEDYGIWVLDAQEHPENYDGKMVHFQARAQKSMLPGSKIFIPGRMAMTCCAEDTSFLGMVCKSDQAPRLKNGEWIDLTAKMGVERRPEYYGRTGPVLYARQIVSCAPLETEMVYFN